MTSFQKGVCLGIVFGGLAAGIFTILLAKQKIDKQERVITVLVKKVTE